MNYSLLGIDIMELNTKHKTYVEEDADLATSLEEEERKKQFNLSEKLMYQMGDEELDDNNMVVHQDDVKEFIKELKVDMVQFQNHNAHHLTALFAIKPHPNRYQRPNVSRHPLASRQDSCRLSGLSQ